MKIGVMEYWSGGVMKKKPRNRFDSFYSLKALSEIERHAKYAKIKRESHGDED